MYDIERLYSGKDKLEVLLEEYPSTWNIEMVGLDGKPDCMIGHFGYNAYFRTKAGTQRRKYTSLGIALREVKKAIKKQGLTVIKITLIDEEGKERNV